MIFYDIIAAVQLRNNIYFKMKRVSDQTSNITSAIGAIFIIIFFNMEIATHKRNDKIYINFSLNCNNFFIKLP